MGASSILQSCEVSPSCLECPLPVCKYDDPGMVARERRRARNRELVEAVQDQGLTKNEAAQRFGVNRRTVQRILAEARA